MDKQKALMKKKDIQSWFEELSSGNLCGLRDVVDNAFMNSGGRDYYINSLLGNCILFIGSCFRAYCD